jgi:hypothetical protein
MKVSRHPLECIECSLDPVPSINHELYRVQTDPDTGRPTFYMNVQERGRS